MRFLSTQANGRPAGKPRRMAQCSKVQAIRMRRFVGRGLSSWYLIIFFLGLVSIYRGVLAQAHMSPGTAITSLVYAVCLLAAALIAARLEPSAADRKAAQDKSAEKPKKLSSAVGSLGFLLISFANGGGAGVPALVTTTVMYFLVTVKAVRRRRRQVSHCRQS